jgi:hypothetical protein
MLNDTQSGSASAVNSGGERLSRFLARRFSRRSFLGVVGGSGLAMVGAGTIGVSTAEANACGCSGLSVTCYDYAGTSTCPSWTCECGFWDMCPGGTADDSPCPADHPVKRWHDCCDGQCNDFRCYGGAPSCCNPKAYGGGCGTVGSTLTRCRYWSCQTNAAC